jgi:glutathionyl-hydroquinone reductase
MLRFIGAALVHLQLQSPNNIFFSAHRVIPLCRYGSINDGVYRCGFAQSQAAYDEAVGTCVSVWASIACIHRLLLSVCPPH